MKNSSKTNAISTSIVKILFKILGKSNHSNNLTEIKFSLSKLHPGVDTGKLLFEYYVDKVNKMLLASLAGGGLVAALLLSTLTGGRLSENNTIPRNSWGKGTYQMTLRANTEEYDYGEISLDINEESLTDEELNIKTQEAFEQIKLQMLGNNVSLDHVENKLNLMKEINGFPFAVRFESSDYLLIDESGNIKGEDIAPNGESVILKAILSLNGDVAEMEIPVRVFNRELSYEEKMQQMLKESIEKADEVSKEDEYQRLPDSIAGNSLSWTEKKDNYYVLMLICLAFLLIGIWKGTDKDLGDKVAERNNEILVDYSEFVSKLQILISSGMTIRGALERMFYTYRVNLDDSSKRKYVYEELGICVKKIQDGMSEAESYEYFGNRMGLACYKKLASLICQNLRKGNEGLIEALDTEISRAFEERKAVVKRRGEEAQTKLIFPMMIMLGIVMVIIMIPAYLSFGGTTY